MNLRWQTLQKDSVRVSVITPSLNQGRFIERTLRSVAEQTGVSVGHVVFDGGSTDNTLDVLRHFSPQVRWVSERDNGQSHAVNKGILATDGEIIAWLNSDDVYFPGALESVAAFFGENPDVDVLYGMADHIDADGRIIEAYPVESWDLERLKETCFICQPAAFFRRRTIDRYGLLDESLHYCMDYDFWLRLGMGGARFAYLGRKLAGSRLYPENKTLGARVKVHKEINDMLKRQLGRVPDRWLFNYAHAVGEQRHSRNKNATAFAIEVGATSILSAIKWNRRISAAMFRTLWSWIRGKQDLA